MSVYKLDADDLEAVFDAMAAAATELSAVLQDGMPDDVHIFAGPRGVLLVVDSYDSLDSALYWLYSEMAEVLEFDGKTDVVEQDDGTFHILTYWRL